MNVLEGEAQAGNFAQVGIAYTNAQVYMHKVQGSPDKIRIPTQWNVIGRSMCYRPAVFIHFVSLRFHTLKEKFSTLLKKVIIPSFAFLKLRTSEFE
jgi:hypothetical protein